MWIDRTGREVGTIGPPGGYVSFSIAPDGRRVYFDRTQPGIGTPDIWSFDLERGVETRITSEVGSELAPLGLRDGRGLIYSANRGSPTELFSLKERGWQTALGSEDGCFDVSPDGKRFLAAVPEVLADKLPLTVVVNWAAEVAEK